MLIELLATLRLEILHIGLREHGQEWVYNQVNSPFSRLYLILDGEAETTHHGQVFRMSPGTLNLIPSFTTADYCCTNRFRYYYIHFTSRITGGTDLFNLADVAFQLNSGDEMLNLFAKLLHLLPDRDLLVCQPHAPEQRTLPPVRTPIQLSSGTWLEIDGILRQILSPIAATAKETLPMPEGFAKVLAFIDAHINRQITVTELAELCGQHPNYFSGQFKKTFGIPPCDYLNRYRIERAQTLMFTGKYNMKEIADMLGFNDPAYFARTFKRYAKISPSDYLRVQIKSLSRGFSKNEAEIKRPHAQMINHDAMEHPIQDEGETLS